MARIAINGFGRIGRLVYRALHEQGLDKKDLEVVAVGDLVPADNLAYLLKYDSTQGPFKGSAAAKDDATLVVDGREIKVVQAPTPAGLPWKALGVDLVIEATGLFVDAAKAAGHLEAGAKRVLVTAPAKGEDLTVVLGVNDAKLEPGHRIVSNASCTTNGLAPVVHVLMKEGFGIAEGLMTTVHSYTANQKTVDGPSRKDWRFGRTAAMNIIPNSTGAAKAIALVIPELKGRLTGMAFRVPTPTVSVIDLTVRTEKATSLAEIRAAMLKASGSYLQGILGVTDEELVSSDLIHDARSSIFDAGASIQLNERFFKLVAWYDNEWGYSNRVAELAARMAAQI